MYKCILPRIYLLSHILLVLQNMLSSNPLQKVGMRLYYAICNSILH